MDLMSFTKNSIQPVSSTFRSSHLAWLAMDYFGFGTSSAKKEKARYAGMIDIKSFNYRFGKDASMSFVVLKDANGVTKFWTENYWRNWADHFVSSYKLLV